MKISIHLLAKIGVDTAENEPNVNVWCNAATCTSYLQPSSGKTGSSFDAANWTAPVLIGFDEALEDVLDLCGHSSEDTPTPICGAWCILKKAFSSFSLHFFLFPLSSSFTFFRGEEHKDRNMSHWGTYNQIQKRYPRTTSWVASITKLIFIHELE